MTTPRTCLPVLLRMQHCLTWIIIVHLWTDSNRVRLKQFQRLRTIVCWRMHRLTDQRSLRTSFLHHLPLRVASHATSCNRRFQSNTFISPPPTGSMTGNLRVLTALILGTTLWRLAMQVDLS